MVTGFQLSKAVMFNQESYEGLEPLKGEFKEIHFWIN